jgi:hypothetical protein
VVPVGLGGTVGHERGEDSLAVFVGIDWAEDYHDVCVLDEQGRPLAARRILEGLEGVALVHQLVADEADDPAEVIVRIQTDRGLLVDALVAAGYQVYAINPLAVCRYRERHTPRGRSLTAGMRRY